MAATSLIALIDDIATVLDDVATLTQVAARKTVGVLGDDLALNAQQVAGVRAERELPVVWAVAKGSMINKAVLVPAALAVSALAPGLVSPLLMVGGAFLCYEGCEKLAHRWLGTPARQHEQHVALTRALTDPAQDLVAFERDKIKGAIRTDFVLSAEIIAITLGAVAAAPLPTQLGVLAGMAVAMTIGVYGFVAGIVKLDDAGLHLSRRETPVARAVGVALLRSAPWLMKGLSVAGTVAMFLVGGGIVVHGVPLLQHAGASLAHALASAPAPGPVLAWLAPLLLDAGVGVAVGAAALAALAAMRRLAGRVRAS